MLLEIDREMCYHSLKILNYDWDPGCWLFSVETSRSPPVSAESSRSKDLTRDLSTIFPMIHLDREIIRTQTSHTCISMVTIAQNSTFFCYKTRKFTVSKAMRKTYSAIKTFLGMWALLELRIIGLVAGGLFWRRREGVGLWQSITFESRDSDVYGLILAVGEVGSFKSSL